MKFHHPTFLLGFLFSINVYSQTFPQNIFLKTYDNGNEDRITDFIEDKDWGFVCAGYTSSIGAGGEDVWLFKTDSLGDTLWQKTFGGIANDFCYSIKKATDGGFILSGSFQSNMQKHPYIIKTDSLGTLQWEFNGANYDIILYDAVELDNGDIVGTGHVENSAGAAIEDYLLKLDSAGNFIWEKWFNFSTADGAGRAVKSPEGNIVVNSFTLGAAGDINIFKCDTSGSSIWSSYLSPTANADGVYDIISNPIDSTYLISGITNYHYPTTPSEGYLIKMNNNGDTLWTETIQGTGDYFLSSSAFDVNGDIISFGDTYGICSPIASSLLLAKSTSSGVVTDVAYYCDSSFNWTANRIIKTHDNKFVIAGIKFIGMSANSIDGFLIKLNADSIFTSSNEIISQTNNDISIYPNPAHEHLIIHSTSAKQFLVTIYDIFGKVFLSQEINNAKTEINLLQEEIPTGIYFISIRTTENIFVYKIIII